jgi:RNA polymerase-binding transcription factor DksA
MNLDVEKLYTELRMTQIELEATLRVKRSSKINHYIEAELSDVEESMRRLENGQFGTCELSGELIPADILQLVPTIKTKKDLEHMQTFYRKSLH